MTPPSMAFAKKFGWTVVPAVGALLVLVFLLLPAASVDQFAATLGHWFGVSHPDLLASLPDLGNFPPSRRDLGFMRG